MPKQFSKHCTALQFPFGIKYTCGIQSCYRNWFRNTLLILRHVDHKYGIDKVQAITYSSYYSTLTFLLWNIIQLIFPPINMWSLHVRFNDYGDSKTTIFHDLLACHAGSFAAGFHIIFQNVMNTDEFLLINRVSLTSPVWDIEICRKMISH